MVYPEYIDSIIKRLEAHGESAYIVGGSLRDTLLGKTPHDYDVATSALPEKTVEIFSDKRVIETGIKHGTVTLIWDGEPVEITTFRVDGSYTDSRHPDAVSFTSDIVADLSRRDFTVNAMCYNDNCGLIDLFGGIDDIKAKTLRAVGDAKSRFCEDALRILRLFRFSATLEFSIEKNTFEAAVKYAPLLSNISAERIFSELQKAALGNNVTALSPLLFTDALADYCLKNADLSNITKLEKRDNLRLFSLLNLTSYDFKKTLDAFKCSNIFKEYCLKMNYLSKAVISSDKICIKKALNFAGLDIVNDILLYYRDILNTDITNHKLLLDEILKNKEPYKISQLDISGTDIVDLGYNGKTVGEKLEFLLNEVIENPDLNHRRKLLNLICN